MTETKGDRDSETRSRFTRGASALGRGVGPGAQDHDTGVLPAQSGCSAHGATQPGGSLTPASP